MRLAAVIPHYYKQRESSLREAVAALLGQTRPPDEVIVWNNESDPIDFGSDARVINSPRNVGAFARFFAALTASTDFVFFQDNDLKVRPDTLRQLLDWTKLRPGVLTLHGYSIPVGDSYSRRTYCTSVRELTRVNVTLGRADLVPWCTVPRALLKLDEIPQMDDLWFSARCRDLRVAMWAVPVEGDAGIVNLEGWREGASSEDKWYEERDRVWRKLFPKEAA
jgi:hypothetical protein